MRTIMRWAKIKPLYVTQTYDGGVMSTYQNKILLPKRTIVSYRTRLGKTPKIVYPLLWILLFAAIVPCIAVSQIDTSEEGMNKNFQKLMRNSETIVDAQVITKEYKWDSSQAIKTPYTIIKLKVFQTIKGTVDNSELTFKQLGNEYSNVTYKSGYFHSVYNLNERSIHFFRESTSTEYLNEAGRYQIGRNGKVFMGYNRVDANEFLDIIKKSVSDTTEFRKYYHRCQAAQANLQMPQRKILQNSAGDSVMQKNSNLNDGGVK